MNEESPFTKVPNSILDFEGFDVYKFRIFMFILRKTIGFNKNSDGISLSQFIKATKLSKNRILKTLKELKKDGFLKIDKQLSKSGGNSFNRYTPLVPDMNYLVPDMNKGSSLQALGVVHEKNTQKNNNTKENIQKEREGEIFKSIYFQLSKNEKLREVESYIDHLISQEDYVKSVSAFKRKIHQQIEKEDFYQLKDFEIWYLEKECNQFKKKYLNKYIGDDLISDVYNYFDTESYNTNNKFILWLNKDELNEKIKTFSSKKEILKFLEDIK